MAVRMANGAPVGPATKLFSCRKSEDYRREYDVSPDGQRFLFVEPAEGGASRSEVNVVLNWFEELKAKVPTRR
jgi:hypothetical protein